MLLCFSGKRLPSRLVEEPATLLAIDDLFASLDGLHRRGGKLHVATGADSVFDGYNCSVAFAAEQPIESIQQILIDLRGQVVALFLQFLAPRLPGFGFLLEIGQLTR